MTRNGKDCPLKAEFTRLMKEKYGAIKKLNQAWGKSIASWADFDHGFDSRLTNAVNRQDYSDLLFAYGDKYFQIVHDALEKYMPNHMYLGCRFTHWGMPNEVLKAAGVNERCYVLSHCDGSHTLESVLGGQAERVGLVGAYRILDTAKALFTSNADVISGGEKSSL